MVVEDKRAKEERKPFSLKEIKQNITKETTYINNITRKLHENKERSYSNAEAMNRYSRSGQKLKISMVKSDRFHPLLA
jgi:hypothetical protein